MDYSTGIEYVARLQVETDRKSKYVLEIKDTFKRTHVLNFKLSKLCTITDHRN